MKKFFPLFVIFLSFVLSSFSFSFAQDSADPKLLAIEQTVGRLQETQKQIAEKQSQIKAELDDLRILINRFR